MELRADRPAPVPRPGNAPRGPGRRAATLLALVAPLLCGAAAGAQESLPPESAVVRHPVGPGAPRLEPYRPSWSGTWECPADGMLYAWALAEGLAPVLRLEDGEGRLLAEDLQSGGVDTPWIQWPVAAGDVLRLHAAAGEPAAAGVLEVRLEWVGETAAAGAAADLGRERRGEIDRLLAEGRRDAARELLDRIVADLLAARAAGGGARAVGELCYAARRAHQLGDLRCAARAWECALEHWERTAPPDHLELQSVRGNLAIALVFLGQKVQAARFNLARTLFDLGRYREARDYQEQVLKGLTELLPPGDSRVRKAQALMAMILEALYDRSAAQAHRELSLASLSRNYPSDHPEVLWARLKYAESLADRGDLGGAHALQASVLATLSSDPEVNAQILHQARLGMARTHRLAGALDAAEGLEREVLEDQLPSSAEDSPALQRTRRQLGRTLALQGELEEALGLAESALAGWSLRLEDSHPQVQEALALAGGMHRQLSILLSLANGGGLSAPAGDLALECFGLVETLRAAQLLSGLVLREAHDDPVLRELAPGARFLHVASHGFFAPESIPSRPAAEPEPIDRWLGLGTPASGLTWVRGLSPMILAGLALSGANRGPDAGGRLRGVVTARFPVSRTRAR